MNQRVTLDNVLRYLVSRPIEFYKVGSILADLKMPADDKNEIMNIVDNLEQHNHIEVMNERYDYPSIKITGEGIDFITRTSYDESVDVSDIKIKVGISAHFGRPQKEKLEERQLELNVQALQNQLKDYPKLESRARRAEVLVVISLILSALSILLSVMMK